MNPATYKRPVVLFQKICDGKMSCYHQSLAYAGKLGMWWTV